MLRSSAGRLDYVPKVLETAYHQWRSIAMQVAESGVPYRGNTLSTESSTIKHSVPWSIAPMLFLVYSVLRSGITVAGYAMDTRWIHSSMVRLILGNEIYPPEARFMIEATVFLSSIYNLSTQIFMFTRSLADYRFLAILAIDKYETIKPSMLGLEHQDYHKLSTFISRSILYARLISLMNLFYVNVLFYQSLKEHKFEVHHLPLVMLHMSLFYYWTSVIAMGIIYHPVLLVILVYYHRFKAGGALKYLDRLNDCLDKRMQQQLKHPNQGKYSKDCKIFYYQSYNSLAKCYVLFMEEVKEYQQHYWSLYLSLLFVFMQMLITCMLFLSITEKLSLIYVWGMYMITSVLIINLMLVAYFCRYIHTINRSMANGLFTLNFRLQHLRWYGPREYIKLEANCINIRNKQDGFRLYDGKLISSPTFMVILFNVSAVFLLVFKMRFN